ncbi:hypothetical protein L915_00410 [Phytophthora nicotianae]|uniref:Uncharacterized protein n=1 Tax=Phytophthora nicotianae TaxID=4792 RepID=W2HNZ9_PHYNI|nr:hypothetical protein L915_00410 [Phytophthora nicotianae]ETL50329.1 hypothetical protein L916_00413 [Phytophthora nicotianae]
MQPREDRVKQNETYVRNVTLALQQTEIILLRSYITVVVLTFYVCFLRDLSCSSLQVTQSEIFRNDVHYDDIHHCR